MFFWGVRVKILYSSVLVDYFGSVYEYVGVWKYWEYVVILISLQVGAVA